MSILKKILYYFNYITKKWWLWCLLYLQYQVWIDTGGWYEYYNIQEKITIQQEINLTLMQNNLKNAWILKEPQHQREYAIHYFKDTTAVPNPMP